MSTLERRIVVGKKWDKDAQYIGRPSPLGNPFFLKDESQRDKVIADYKTWLDRQLEDGNELVINELDRLVGILMNKGVLVLGCYCSPKACHGDVIKEVILARI